MMRGMRYSPVASSRSVSIAHRLGGVHRRVPRHVRHVEEQRVDRVGIARPRVGDDHVHQPVRGERRLPGKGLVDAQRRAVGRRRSRSSGPVGKPSGMPGERRAGSDGLAGRLLRRRAGFGNGGLKRKPPGQSIRAEQHLQQVERAAGVEAVANAPRCRAWRAWPPAGRRCSRAGAPSSRSRAMSSVIVCSKATSAISAAMRRMASAGTPQRAAAASGA